MSTAFIQIDKKLQVWHFPQIGSVHFGVDVNDEVEAYKVMQILADQHLFLYKANLIGDYCNTLRVMMWCKGGEENGEDGWIDYEHYGMSWEELEAAYFPDSPPLLKMPVIALSYDSLVKYAMNMFPDCSEKESINCIINKFFNDSPNQLYSSPSEVLPIHSNNKDNESNS